MKNEHNNVLFFETARSTPGWTAAAITNGKWKYQPHLAAIDHLLVLCAQRKISKLVINLPPRHGKSELISKFFPFWHLGNFPDSNIILASYESSIAASWGRKTSELVKKHGSEFFGISLDPRRYAAEDFGILGRSGGMVCAGAGGAITGRGADLLIIDDPVKNDAIAHSAVMRDNIWEWFTATAFTRLEPNGVCIIVMTRWHEDDLCGRLLRSGARVIDSDMLCDLTSGTKPEPVITADEWLVLKLPAIAGANDPLGRKIGEPLWKRRFSAKKLEEIKTQLGGYWFASLYQQNPAPADGGIMKRSDFRYFSVEGEICKLSGARSKALKLSDCSLFATVDVAARISERADYTVAIIFVVTKEKDILIFDVIREKLEGAEHLNFLRTINSRYKPLLIGIESVQYQISLFQSALRDGLPVKELKADKDKLSRLLPMAARLSAGAVYFRQGAHWLDEFENELLAFPSGKHDDQADAFAYIGYMINLGGNLLPTSAGRSANKNCKLLSNWMP